MLERKEAELFRVSWQLRTLHRACQQDIEGKTNAEKFAEWLRSLGHDTSYERVTA